MSELFNNHASMIGSLDAHSFRSRTVLDFLSQLGLLCTPLFLFPHACFRQPRDTHTRLLSESGISPVTQYCILDHGWE